jgi:hypothetical protein
MISGQTRSDEVWTGRAGPRAACAGAARQRRAAGGGVPLPGDGSAGRVTGKAKPLPPHLQVWVDARRRYRLSHVQVQMARELGLNPKKFGKLANHRQERWKAPLPQFIEHVYARRFGRQQPEVVVSVEDHARQLEQKKATRKATTASAEPAGQTPADTAAG